MMPWLILEETDGSMATETSYMGIHPSPLSNQPHTQSSSLRLSDYKLHLDIIGGWKNLGSASDQLRPPPNVARKLPQQGVMESEPTPPSVLKEGKLGAAAWPTHI